MSKSVRIHRGFTIIEMLVVVSIVTILISMLLPALGKSREAAMLTVCASNLHQDGLFTQTHLDNNHGRFPVLFYHWTPGGNQGNVVNIHLQPQFAAAPGWLSYYPYNTLTCPSDPTPESWPGKDFNGNIFYVETSYAFNMDFLMRDYVYDEIDKPSELAIFFDGYPKKVLTTPGQGNNNNFKQGAYPGSQDFSDRAFDGRHFGTTANVLFADWHVDQSHGLTMADLMQQGNQPILGPGNGGD